MTGRGTRAPDEVPADRARGARVERVPPPVWRTPTAVGAPDEVPVDHETDLERVHALWRREWWSAAKALLALGHDVLVLDPDVLVPETWSLDGETVCEVHPTRAIGWRLEVVQSGADPLEEDE